MRQWDNEITSDSPITKKMIRGNCKILQTVCSININGSTISCNTIVTAKRLIDFQKNTSFHSKCKYVMQNNSPHKCQKGIILFQLIRKIPNTK